MSGSLTTYFFWALAVILLGISLGEINETALAQNENTIVARVDGASITLREVDDSLVSQLLPLQQQIYALRKVALENLVVGKILADEANKRGVSVDELRRALTAGNIAVSPSQVEEAYDENASVFAAMSPDEAKERLRLDLENHARMRNYREALADLRKNSNMQVLLEEPRLPSFNNANNAPSIGSNEAPVSIIEFSDFQCPYCRDVGGTIKQVLRNYGSDVRIIFKHLPLDIHAEAFASARAAFCAGEQGFFWQYHDALFSAETFSPEAFSKMASELGLSIPNFQACLSSEVSRTAILKDMREAKQFGINTTPTFIVNGVLVRGAIGLEEFKTIIGRELKSARNTSRSNQP